MNQQSPSRILTIACGGTGGHFYPSLAVAREFQRLGGQAILLVAGKHAAEQKQLAADQGFKAYELQAVPLPRNLLHSLLFLWKFCLCILQARRLLQHLHPDLLLGMGSFAAVPACLALSRRQLPLVLHEGNAYMGKANRFLAGKASAVALSLPLAQAKATLLKRCHITGMPLREVIIKAAADRDSSQAAELLSELGLSVDRKTILVFGGSQGARFINQLMTHLVPLLARHIEQLQLLCLTGTDDNRDLQQACRQAGLAAGICRGVADIERYYLAADLVICRAGASSICELALFRKPVILIPLPSAADDHQRINARMLEKTGAAFCLEQKEASPETLQKLILDCLQNPEKWQEKGRKLGEMARPQAAGEVVKLLNKTLTGLGK